jgi:hypothetical protein
MVAHGKCLLGQARKVRPTGEPNKCLAAVTVRKGSDPFHELERTRLHRAPYGLPIVITFTWPGPRCVDGYTEAQVTGPLRIRNSLQFRLNSLLQAITSARSEGPSKQCRQDLIVSSKLYPGLLLFLIVRLSVTLQSMCSSWRISLLPCGVRVLCEVLVHPPEWTGMSPGLQSW